MMAMFKKEQVEKELRSRQEWRSKLESRVGKGHGGYTSQATVDKMESSRKGSEMWGNILKQMNENGMEVIELPFDNPF